MMIPYVRTIEGSVKTIRIIDEPTPDAPGLADFYAKDNYSVFDWGRMPLPERASIDNRALLVEAAFNFEMLKAAGLPVGYRGVVTEDGNLLRFKDAVKSGKPPVAIRMRFVNVLPVGFDDGEYDYSRYANPAETNYMVPVEWIFREKGPLADGASLTKRLQLGECRPADYGLPEHYVAGDPLPFRIADFSTKYERTDRYLAPDRLACLSGLTREDFMRCKELNLSAADIVVNHAASRGIKVYDGKVEFAVSNRPSGIIELTDFVGTKDENRRSVMPQGALSVEVPSSKQAKRNAHKRLDPEWYAACEEEKKLAEKERRQDWKERVRARGLAPKPLPAWFIEADNYLSNAVVNTITGSSMLPAPSLVDAALEFDDARKRLEAMVSAKR